MLSSFDIVDKLGEGSYSSVYQVRRKCDRKTYAMKKVNLPFLSEKERENALNEHPNIIAYKECFFDQEHRVLWQIKFVIMEHADGGDLLQRIRQHRESKTFLQESTIWNIFIQITQALKALHDNHIVHRDLKSANILLYSDGRAKLTDFNVSKIVKNNMTRTQIGTPFYASPEIWNFIPYDYKSDMWSLGCILYEMCCLRTPFQGKDMQQICRRVCRGLYQKIPTIYSHEIYGMIKVLLQINPEIRPDCDQLLQDPHIQNHIRHSNNQTLLFSTISENNCEMLSTIQWSRKGDQPTDTTITVANKKKGTNKQNLQLDQRFEELLSVRLPPPHYTPSSNQRRRGDFETLPENYTSQTKVTMYSIQTDSRNKSNPKNANKLQKKVVLNKSRNTEKPQSRSVDEGNDESKLPYDHYIENSLIQEQIEEDPLHANFVGRGGKPKLQLRPLNNMAFQHSNRKLQVRTETSQSKRLKIFSVQNSQDTPLTSLQQQDHSILPHEIDLGPDSHNSIERMPNRPHNNIYAQRNQRGNRHSLVEQTPEIKHKKQHYSYDQGSQHEVQRHINPEQLTIEEEESDHPQRDGSRNRNKIQIKQIIDLLQGNPLKQPPQIKTQAQPKISSSLPNRGIKADMVNKNLVKQNIEEMKSIKTQMQDINRIIQQSINQNNNKRDLYGPIIKK